ncbi:hypothetical protein BD410DRAFT_808448 [Rickenella mellea]|uniref:Uncharacterized protein n=1 Tax=Rickenella mellea TaxID=50990 RepID=A0A4Y7PLL5_9AGAM|nr:hypothetical protein BD410DRAFT_808448 [Rickenella mellea]
MPSLYRENPGKSFRAVPSMPVQIETTTRRPRQRADDARQDQNNETKHAMFTFKGISKQGGCLLSVSIPEVAYAPMTLTDQARASRRTHRYINHTCNVYTAPSPARPRLPLRLNDMKQENINQSEHIKPNERHTTYDNMDNDAISLTTDSILEKMMWNSAFQGNVQYTLAAGALSASISSQLIGIITSTYPVASGIVHAMLLLACITGILTLASHASSSSDIAMTSAKRRSNAVGSVLSYVSLWLTVFGIVVLAWVIQPQPVAIVVTVLFVLAVLAIIGTQGAIHDKMIENISLEIEERVTVLAGTKSVPRQNGVHIA